MSMNKAIVIGTSAGGIKALGLLLPLIPENFKIPVFIIQHISPYAEMNLRIFSQKCHVNLKEASNNETIEPGIVYFAPPDYHLLIEEDFTLTLNADPKVNFSRPSIDVLFQTAAEAYGRNLTGILLTGTNNDGSEGLKTIKQFGGKTIVQNPAEAEFPEMPQSALKLFDPDMILNLKEIGELVGRL